MTAATQKSFFLRHPSVLVFILMLALFTLAVTLLSQGVGSGLISTSFVKTLGKTLCLCLIAVAMDLVWGYCGILSLGHFAFFGLGGYMIGMWLMYARTEAIVITSLANQLLPPTAQEIRDAVGTQIFGVVGGAEIPAIWHFAHSLPMQLIFVRSRCLACWPCCLAGSPSDHASPVSICLSSRRR